MRRRKFRSNVDLDAAILNFDIKGFFDTLDAQRAAHETARRKRGPSEKEISMARSRRARGMPYEKWILGEE